MKASRPFAREFLGVGVGVGDLFCLPKRGVSRPRSLVRIVLAVQPQLRSFVLCTVEFFTCPMGGFLQGPLPGSLSRPLAGRATRFMKRQELRHSERHPRGTLTMCPRGSA